MRSCQATNGAGGFGQEKRAVGGGNVRFEINVATQLITPNFPHVPQPSNFLEHHCPIYGRSLCALVCGLVISRWVLAAVGKSEFGLLGVIGGMTVIALLAYAVRLVRVGIVAVEMRGERNGEWDYIRNV